MLAPDGRPRLAGRHVSRNAESRPVRTAVERGPTMKVITCSPLRRSTSARQRYMTSTPSGRPVVQPHSCDRCRPRQYSPVGGLRPLPTAGFPVMTCLYGPAPPPLPRSSDAVSSRSAGHNSADGRGSCLVGACDNKLSARGRHSRPVGIQTRSCRGTRLAAPSDATRPLQGKHEDSRRTGTRRRWEVAPPAYTP